MKKADQFSFPCQFTGSYPNGWAGYTFLQKTEQDAYHPGIDWNWGSGEQDNGMPVQAIANGVCVHTSEQASIGYGEIVVLKHELTEEMYQFIKTKYNIDARIIYSFYAHMKDSNVKLNQEVERGDLIGWIGKSGTTVSHLHQELYKSVPGTTWRYWPKLSAGWTLDKLKQYYMDTYDLIQNQPINAPPPPIDPIIISQSDAFIAVCGKLNVPANKELALGEIDKLIGYEDKVIEKDRQITQLRLEMSDLQDKFNIQADKQKEALEKVEELNLEVGKSKLTIETLTSANEVAQAALISLQDQTKLQPMTGFKKFIFDVFFKGR